MTQQPFSRPGAIDLSGLTRPAAGAGQGAPGGGGGAPAGGSSYWLEITEETFQPTVEASLTAPVLLAFYSPTRLAESE
ncbi:MAG: putative thioredoxin, partial [Nocardioidaceae bacterium]|nr:putative thioredoxin [Nocardioidaceae bacterium]